MSFSKLVSCRSARLDGTWILHEGHSLRPRRKHYTQSNKCSVYQRTTAFQTWRSISVTHLFDTFAAKTVKALNDGKWKTLEKVVVQSRFTGFAIEQTFRTSFTTTVSWSSPRQMGQVSSELIDRTVLDKTEPGGKSARGGCTNSCRLGSESWEDLIEVASLMSSSNCMLNLNRIFFSLYVYNSSTSCSGIMISCVAGTTLIYPSEI